MTAVVQIGWIPVDMKSLTLPLGAVIHMRPKPKLGPIHLQTQLRSY